MRQRSVPNITAAPAIAAALLLALVACTQERLVIVNVLAAPPLALRVVDLTVMSSAHGPRDVSVPKDGGTPVFPFTLGLYVPRDTDFLHVDVSGFAFDGALIAQGGGDFSNLGGDVVK